MHGHYRASAIRVTQEMMTSFCPNDFESECMQRADHLPAGQPRLARHDSDSDALHADKLGHINRFSLDFEAEFDRFASAHHQHVQRLGLRMAPWQAGYARHEVTIVILLDHEVEGAVFGFHAANHASRLPTVKPHAESQTTDNRMTGLSEPGYT